MFNPFSNGKFIIIFSLRFVQKTCYCVSTFAAIELYLTDFLDAIERWLQHNAGVRGLSGVSGMLESIKTLNRYGMFFLMPNRQKKTKDAPPNTLPTSSTSLDDTCRLNRMQTRGVTGNTRYQDAIQYINRADDDDNLFSGEPVVIQQPKLNPRNKAFNPPTRRTEAQNRRQRGRNRQARLARNEEEDFSNDIARVFETMRPITPPPASTEFEQTPSLSPPFPPNLTPSIPQNLHYVLPPGPEVGTVMPFNTVLNNAPKTKTKSTAKDVWFFFSKADNDSSNFCKLCR